MYLFDNQTGQGRVGKVVLDDFKGTTLDDLKKAARGQLQLRAIQINLEYLDTTMEEYVPLVEGLTTLPNLAVIRVSKQTRNDKVQ